VSLASPPASDPLSCLWPLAVGVVAGRQAASPPWEFALLALSFLALLLICALLSASEMTLFYLASFRGETQRPREGPGALARLLDRPLRTHFGIHVGQMVVIIAAAATGGALVFWIFPALSALTKLVVAGFLVTPVIVVLGVILPRSLALRSPDVAARLTARPLLALLWVFSPLRFVMETVGNRVVRLAGAAEGLAGPLVKERELLSLVALGGEEGTLEEDERAMVEGVLDFGATTAEDIMTPRTEIELVHADDSRECVAEVFERQHHSRVLVYGDTPDHVVGFIHHRDFLLYPEKPWPSLLREPLVVAPAMGLGELLKLFRTRRVFIAVVADEYGGTSGIVTLNDVLEAIVGDLGEGEEGARGLAGGAMMTPMIRQGPDGSWIVRGRTELWELNEELRTDLPDDRARTLSGLVISCLGRIPREGEECVTHGWRFRVLRTSGPRIEEVALSVVATGQGSAGEGSRNGVAGRWDKGEGMAGRRGRRAGA
jgi:putative hemolysin